MTECKHYIISGLVQGVFYRESTRRKAVDLNVSGWVSNLPDGRVEVLACGVLSQLETFAEWLWEGPTHAQVSDVSCETVELESVTGFEIR